MEELQGAGDCHCRRGCFSSSLCSCELVSNRCSRVRECPVDEGFGLAAYLYRPLLTGRESPANSCRLRGSIRIPFGRSQSSVEFTRGGPRKIDPEKWKGGLCRATYGSPPEIPGEGCLERHVGVRASSPYRRGPRKVRGKGQMSSLRLHRPSIGNIRWNRPANQSFFSTTFFSSTLSIRPYSAATEAGM